MKKTILIAPFDGPLATAIAAEASSAGWSSVLALPRDAATHESADGSVVLSYQPRSYVSVASLVLSAENAVGPLDAAILILDPADAKADFLASKPGELAALIEELCAGPVYLARELVRRFESRRSGRILFAAPESPRDAAPGPLASMSVGAFEGLASGLFAAAAASGSWSAYGLRDASGVLERTARYVLELLSEPKPAKAGRWQRYSGKAGIFAQ